MVCVFSKSRGNVVCGYVAESAAENPVSLKVGYGSGRERKSIVQLKVTGDLNDPLQIIMGNR